jgi:hypothetical protein
MNNKAYLRLLTLPVVVTSLVLYAGDKTRNSPARVVSEVNDPDEQAGKVQGFMQ